MANFLPAPDGGREEICQLHELDVRPLWSVVTVAEKCYEYFDEPKHWEGAEESCKRRGGHLVSIARGARARVAVVSKTSLQARGAFSGPSHGAPPKGAL